mmetsp:Transcript_38317/g.89114  ORF Transcript_38317/g.89114 Transcript_38317/m.89114 type:complete len:375 (-) Transcript_38317:48-1172(-)|eukprot:CAMPEP_0113316648 /NCGR_PEP_ID=MMETSP0010_2-20120614/11847_1 /TAXON_ID=216773 ORGANISM="Corethron hystrix, Strain 308" /NCGR_SAMPLE_ID=MMETSP0010_2 /ASSEMBLY_ACC=CAM_ASM_000155 /LENGTH=374 /DNA_ID=CAMNT_0000173421 /DNA_START=50 /DNA_END=1174 /DNA_ORIENTATION=- /assembly_acc=CAM_ASM_000155
MMELKVKSTTFRKLAFAVPSFLLGIWAFQAVNAVSGPYFEPILEACGNPDKNTPIEEFAQKTGYHEFEPKVGFKAFDLLVCLITQFLYKLNQTHPQGVIVWGGVVLVSFPVALSSIYEAGRNGSRGPIRYPVVFGLLYQLFGVSVMYPLLWVPFYIFGRAAVDSPRAGIHSNLRIWYSAVAVVPVVVLTMVVFMANPESYLWTVSAGILGGPGLPLMNLILYTDASASASPSLVVSKERIDETSRRIQNIYGWMTGVSVIGWAYLVKVAVDAYVSDSVSVSVLAAFEHLWRDIWTEANASVAFMTIDTGVFYLGLFLFVAYQCEAKAFKMLVLTPILGPGGAGCWVLKELEADVCQKRLDVLARSSGSGDTKEE